MAPISVDMMNEKEIIIIYIYFKSGPPLSPLHVSFFLNIFPAQN